MKMIIRIKMMKMIKIKLRRKLNNCWMMQICKIKEMNILKICQEGKKEGYRQLWPLWGALRLYSWMSLLLGN